MADEEHGDTAFDYFWEHVARLQASRHFRDVLKELDEGRKETLSLLVSDPATYLRYRGVDVPQDFRVSVKRTFQDAATHGTGGGGQGHIIICDCVEVCFLRYCTIYCYCRIFE